MKKVNIFALCGLLFGIMACSSEGEKHADVTLSTVQCGMCKKTIESGMAKVDGISKFDIDLISCHRKSGFCSWLSSQ